MAHIKIVGILKKCNKVPKIAHVWRVTSQARVGAESFSLERILRLMVPNWGPHPLPHFPP